MFEKYSPDCPSQKNRMSLRFAFSSPAHIIASFFGSGVLRPASGTWGTLAGFFFYLAFDRWIPLTGWIVLIILSFVVGAWASQVTGKDIGVHDHGSIVIDEVFAIWLVLITVPPSLTWQFSAFLGFRFFDVIKMPPARYFDTRQRWQNGWGVMLDDAAAAVQTIILFFLLEALVL